MSAMQARALTALHKLYLQFCKACYSQDMADAHQSQLNVQMPPPSAFQASLGIGQCLPAALQSCIAIVQAQCQKHEPLHMAARVSLLQLQFMQLAVGLKLCLPLCRPDICRRRSIP